MEFERTEPVPNYVFTFEQSDASLAELDFSAPAEFGDFAFYRQRSESKHPEYFFSYHTNTAGIFRYFLRIVAHQPDALDQLAQIDRCTQEFEQAGLVPTSQGQSDFSESELSAMLESLSQGDLPVKYSGGDLTLNPNDRYTICRLPEHGRAVEIPHRQAWQFVAGMIWRSYAHPGTDPNLNLPSRSRHSTATFKKAIATAIALQGER